MHLRRLLLPNYDLNYQIKKANIFFNVNNQDIVCEKNYKLKLQCSCINEYTLKKNNDKHGKLKLVLEFCKNFKCENGQISYLALNGIFY